ncbi:hypothetical protein JKP88DRAFT_252558 [Tribonema minus]|uniref:Uncharacterized protein n=1 Tax=Tribonema minus TaxID=303371 RepID=A0A835ZJA5_9STRA|nr:hypothetical protein JKP88DRAFT_252558 [Tribonema minus]
MQAESRSPVVVALPRLSNGGVPVIKLQAHRAACATEGARRVLRIACIARAEVMRRLLNRHALLQLLRSSGCPDAAMRRHRPRQGQVLHNKLVKFGFSVGQRMRSDALEAAISDEAQIRLLLLLRHGRTLLKIHSRHLEEARKNLTASWLPLSKDEYRHEIRWRQQLVDALAHTATETEVEIQLHKELRNDRTLVLALSAYQCVDDFLRNHLFRRGLSPDMSFYFMCLLAGFGHVSLEQAAQLDEESACFEHVHADLVRQLLDTVHPKQPPQMTAHYGTGQYKYSCVKAVSVSMHKYSEVHHPESTAQR